jgi:hypothetical protein
LQYNAGSGWTTIGSLRDKISGSFTIGCEAGVVGTEGRRREVDEFRTLELQWSSEPIVKLDCSVVIVFDVVEDQPESRVENWFSVVRSVFSSQKESRETHEVELPHCQC